jgi:hypothetical protein
MRPKCLIRKPKIFSCFFVDNFVENLAAGCFSLAKSRPATDCSKNRQIKIFNEINAQCKIPLLVSAEFSLFRLKNSFCLFVDKSSLDKLFFAFIFQISLKFVPTTGRL